MHNISNALSPHTVPIADLHQDPANLRQHPARSIAAIATSLARFGQQKPIVIDEAGVVIAGNGTLAAAVSLGWTHVAAVRSDLAGVERLLFSIADNRTAELSSWADEAENVLRSLAPADAAAAGFNASDLNRLFGAGEKLADDDAPEPAPVAVARTGEIWLLGGHRLLCGDSTSRADVDRLMAGNLAALCSTDPPYLVDYTGKRGRQDGEGKDWSHVYKEIGHEHAYPFYRAIFANACGVIADRAAIYCWHAHTHTGTIQRVWAELDILDHQQVIWVKPLSVLGRVFWHFRHEPCMMGWKRGSKPEHDCDFTIDSVWELAPANMPADLSSIPREQLEDLVRAASSVWEIDWEGKPRVQGNEHPTQKPLEIFARPIRKHTREGDIVFEPFSGSGSQMIAAEKTGRRCFAIDQQPVFIDVAIRRWQRLTGKDAVLEGDGRTWSQIRDERLAPAAEVA